MSYDDNACASAGTSDLMDAPMDAAGPEADTRVSDGITVLSYLEFQRLMAKVWAPIANAPKSMVNANGHVIGIYLLLWEPGDPGLGFGGDGDDPQTGIMVGWWEPNEHNRAGGRGCWYNGRHEIHPTFWMPLPMAPEAAGQVGG